MFAEGSEMRSGIVVVYFLKIQSPSLKEYVYTYGHGKYILSCIRLSCIVCLSKNEIYGDQEGLCLFLPMFIWQDYWDY